jgi:hypothetical protein
MFIIIFFLKLVPLGIYPSEPEMQVLNGFFLPKIGLKKFTIGLAIPHFFNTILFKN